MASKVEIKINSAGVAALLKSGEVQADLARRAAAIASAASASGGEFGHGVTVGANRARAGVWTQDVHAMRGEALDRRLTRAFDAGRG